MADFDLTDDLLALAGDEEPAQDEQPTTTKSPSPRPKPSPTPDKDSGPAKGVARKAPKVRGARNKSQATKFENFDDSEEEEEMDRASSPNSLGSGAMSESEDEAPISATTQDVPNVKYPVDGKFTSIREKQDIMSQPEAVRERILAERQEEIDQENFSRQLIARREAAQRDEAAAADKKKRKSAAAELDDSPRKASRQKTQPDDKLANYRKRREQMNEARKTGADRRDLAKEDPSKLFDHDPSDQDSDEYNNRAAKSSAPSRGERQPILKDYQRCQLGRTNFSIVCFTPGFEDAMEGCFVRASIGIDPSTGQNIYRMGQIKEIVTGKRYGMLDNKGVPFTTDQWVRSFSGNAEKTFPFPACSDSPITEKELEYFRSDQERDGKKMLGSNLLDNRLNGLHALLNHRWTSAEITEKARRSGRQQATDTRIERSKLEAQRKTALRQGDQELAKELEEKLEELQGPKLAFGNNLFRNSQKAESGPSVAEMERARRIEAARAAERNRQRMAEAYERKMQKMGKGDTSVRVRTTAITHLDAEKYDSARSRTGTPEPSSLKNGANALKPGNGNSLQVPNGSQKDDLFGEGAGSDAGTPAKSVDGSKPPSKQGTPVPQIKVKPAGLGPKKRRTDDDNIAAIGLDLDIEI